MYNALLKLPSTGGFWTDFQSALRGVKTKFLDFFSKGNPQQKGCKVKNSQVWVPQDNFE